ncbi:heat-inducible transcription repressor HrcA [Halobacillus karajensis]|uniref:Heat-inducible transcription repressor HrcA n=1 Tax=Halobacillus karajensis TaxID=195088 RepID=A0A024P7R5_9BACI|nr:heat-inducible transcriptional repressor HrcA [Halobacillus karajensis]CDQ18052.1 Heat-inducible transcription repressor HrcA [Halobacillus karajensis]CDQ24402.1 Heat-inducible transcription repressor HrcA [Halobacillus karajensis]CDQ29350.1 Heat-inducible transcription repressor HrcA [Halobacillus karajensis]SEH60230.1 heat-inducible transcription repressor HrcA [Halobacillus karajensis]
MLTDRQLLILQVIIDDFILTAQPIGSRSIAKKDAVTFSSATIRNEMADLEEMGFIEKTHSSSGRVPSEKGYRFYVDHLLSPLRLTSKEILTIREAFDDKMMEFERVVQKSAGILSDLTNYTSIVLGPEVFETKLKQLQIVPLSEQSAIAILVTDTGHVEHRAFNVPVEIKGVDLEKMVNILNSRLEGVPLVKLHEKLYTEINDLLKTHTDQHEEAFQYLRAALVDEHPTKLYIGGKTNILMQPEFRDLEKVRSLYATIEQENEMADLLRTGEDGIQVRIGQENPYDAMQNCSLITASYQLGNDQYGTIALLGPTRMEYNRMFSLMNVLSKHMTNTFRGWY